MCFDMKKVLFVVHALRIGGVGTVLTNIVNGLAERGYDITVVSTSNDVSAANSLLPQIKLKYKDEPNFGLLKKIPYIRNFYESGMWSRRQSPKKLYRYFVGTKEKYDVEIAFFFGRPLKALCGSTNCNSKKVYWVHTDYTASKGYLAGFTDKNQAISANKYADEIICVADTVRDSYEKVIGRKENVKTIYNLCDITKIASLSNQQTDANHNKFTFITVGRLSEEKGVMRLIKAVKTLQNKGCLFDLWIIGDGPEKEALETFICKNNLKNVYLFGKQSNPYSYMKKADCYVCPSYFEGFSLVLEEAVVLGLPTVTTMVSGAKELFGDNEFGMIVNNTEEGIEEGMEKMLRDKACYENYKKAVQKRSVFFNPKKILDEIESVLG